MADIPNATSNATLYDELGNPVAVSLNPLSGIYELRVKDKDIYDILQQPTAESAPDLWQYLTSFGRSFSALTPLITIAGQLETDFFLFRNPVGSGRLVKIHDIDYTYNKGSGVSIIRMYTQPTITANGTAITNQHRYLGHANASLALATYSPTISARGTPVRTLGQSATSTFSQEEHLGWLIPEGYTILITVQPAANNTDHSIYMDWSEVVP